MKKKVVTVKPGTARLRLSESTDGFKEEIKAAYGYESVYSVSAVSGISALNTSTGRQNKGQSEKKGEGVRFAEILQKSLMGREQEISCSMHGYGKTGAYEDYLYLKREYRH